MRLLLRARMGNDLYSSLNKWGNFPSRSRTSPRLLSSPSVGMAIITMIYGSWNFFCAIHQAKSLGIKSISLHRYQFD